MYLIREKVPERFYAIINGKNRIVCTDEDEKTIIDNFNSLVNGEVGKDEKENNEAFSIICYSKSVLKNWERRNILF